MLPNRRDDARPDDGRPRGWRAAVAGGALVAALVAGCTGTSTGTAGADDATPPLSTVPGSDVPSDAPRSSLTTPIEGGTPFSPYLAAVDAVAGVSEDAAQASAARQQKVQQLVATCMKDAGFEYVPAATDEAEPTSYPWTEDVVGLPQLPDDRAEVERVGYGVDDVDAAEAARLDSQELDPNDAYAETLGAAGQAEYYATLTGSDGPDDPQPDPTGGCYGRSDAAVPASDDEGRGALAEQYGQLFAGMGSLRMRGLQADTRVADLNARWYGCVLDAGYDLSPPEGVDVDTFSPVDTYFLAVRTPPGGVAGYPGELETADDIPVEERYLVGSAEERAIAVVDFDCRVATDYEQTLVTALVDLEAQFVAAHRQELDELLAAVELGQA